ncbi:DUF6446 family protein [Roseicyclus sp.]|uniref:DUF6446 family protein n=1 Tax=Roseicyclus sp. TaxID=1914329 RepID=UPI003F6A8B81
MSGKIIAIAIIMITALFAAGLWYAQTRAYFDPVDAADLEVSTTTGARSALAHSDFRGIDAASSPLRFRACFRLDRAALAVLDGAVTHPDPTPLIAPDWFDCYDARAIGEAIATGAARAVLSVHDIHRGVDRVIAAFPDGRAFAWHQLNGTLDQ